MADIDEYKSKLEKANENIYKLITKLVDTREATIGASSFVHTSILVKQCRVKVKVFLVALAKINILISYMIN